MIIHADMAVTYNIATGMKTFFMSKTEPELDKALCKYLQAKIHDWRDIMK